MKHILLVSILLLLAMCLVPLWGEQIRPQKPPLAPSIVKQPPKSTIKKTPLEVRIRLLERKVETLEKQIKILLFDNRETKLGIEALKQGEIYKRRQLQTLRISRRQSSLSPSGREEKHHRTDAVVEKSQKK